MSDAVDTERQLSAEPTFARPVAGEDLRVGDHIALFTQAWELPSFLWTCGDFSLSPHELVRLTGTPDEAGLPLKIIGLCLPFVYATNPYRNVLTIDLRRAQVVRLDAATARSVSKAIKDRSRV